MIETQYRAQLDTRDIQDSSLQYETVPVLPPSRAMEIVSVAQHVPNMEFCIPQYGCVQAVTTGREVLLFPSNSTLKDEVNLYDLDKNTTSEVNNEIEVDKNVVDIEAYVESILHNPEEFRRVKKRTIDVHHESALYAEFSPLESTRIALEVGDVFDRISELSKKNGSSTPDEKDEYARLVRELPIIVRRSVLMKQALEEIKSSVVAD